MLRLWRRAHTRMGDWGDWVYFVGFGVQVAFGYRMLCWWYYEFTDLFCCIGLGVWDSRSVAFGDSAD